MGEMYKFGGRQPVQGHFTWNIAADEIHGDAVFADILGLDAQTVNDGFSVLRWMELVHPDDQARVAAAVRTSVLTGRPYLEIYRICRVDDVVTIRESGTCFRYRDGLPSMAAGTLEVVMAETDFAEAANEQTPPTTRRRNLVELGDAASGSCEPQR